MELARAALLVGGRVQLSQRFSGREMMHKEEGLERLAAIVEQLSDIARAEEPLTWRGPCAIITLAPLKPSKPKPLEG